jgi:putative membrane protein
MKELLTPHALGLFALYFLTSVALLGIFVWLYTLVTPYREREDIMAGRAAPALALAGALLGYTAPLLSASYNGVNYFDFLLWGAIACLIQLACFKVIYRLLPGQIEANNVAAGIVYAGAALGVGLINAFSLIP